MARPRKRSVEARKRWDALYVTDAERADICAAAKAQNCSPSRYLIGLHQRRRPLFARDASHVLMALARAEATLLKIANSLPEAPETVEICASLISLERSFERAALPFLLPQGA